jgi:glutamate synthase (NADPH/NADH) small chain
VNPTRIVADDAGWVTGMELQKMELGEPDASGRRRPVPVPGSEYVIDADTVIVAIGNDPNPLIPQTSPGIRTTKWGNIVVDPETQRTSVRGVFAGGDIVLGAATVILAMGEGRRAAAAIATYLQDGDWSGAPQVPETTAVG